MRNFIYSFIMGFILMFSISGISMKFEILDSNLGSIVIILITLTVIVHSITKKYFERASFKDFLLSLTLMLVIVVAGSFVFSFITKMPIDGESVKDFISYLMPISMLIGIYSFYRSSYNILSEDEKQSKIKKCPCCQETISLGYFVWKMLDGMEFISITKNSKGMTCPKCNKEILSPKEKGELKMFPFFISIVPLILFGVFFSFIFMVILSLVLYMLLLSSKYYKVNFRCLKIQE